MAMNPDWPTARAYDTRWIQQDVGKSKKNVD